MDMMLAPTHETSVESHSGNPARGCIPRSGNTTPFRISGETTPCRMTAVTCRIFKDKTP